MSQTQCSRDTKRTPFLRLENTWFVCRQKKRLSPTVPWPSPQKLSWGLIPTPLNLGGFHCNQECAGLMLSDFHQVTFAVGSQRRCSFCWFLQKPHGGACATRKQLPASKPPCCEEAPTRPCRGVPWPSSETKPRAAWPATSCCVHTHSPACLPAPAHV